MSGWVKSWAHLGVEKVLPVSSQSTKGWTRSCNVRWLRPTRHLISPQTFIEVAGIRDDSQVVRVPGGKMAVYWHDELCHQRRPVGGGDGARNCPCGGARAGGDPAQAAKSSWPPATVNSRPRNTGRVAFALGVALPFSPIYEHEGDELSVTSPPAADMNQSSNWLGKPATDNWTHSRIPVAHPVHTRVKLTALLQRQNASETETVTLTGRHIGLIGIGGPA